ncbi:uncharacterized protein N0V89_000451 [Didymosphaeria variabile]|uniref:Uncharacterized protein n=1 Tax=Didymosphaeria variabile TaxID=1932322 RepID=A0A9W8XWQ1_9PLEO|nr:uncharacterized protein N0V89_000451 [Didymosphaeria variabile]KAJ4359895.1 hypothetical protein N0V89_000451 [Didymosphaeria variabile]
MLILTLSALLAHVLQVFELLFRNRREALQPREGGPIGSPPESISVGSAGRSTDTNFNMFNGLELMTPPASVQGSRPGTTASSGLNTPRNGSVVHSFSPTIEKGTTHSVRLSLGTYELDERDEFILQTSLLKIELSKITALIEAFEARLCQTKLHHDLVSYLKQGLGANYEALKRLATVCSRGLGRANCIDIP